MLPITVKSIETFNEETSEFGETKEYKLQLEHSLISLSKWESKWHKPFLDTLEKGKLTKEETIYYIKCMTINHVDPEAYDLLSSENMKEINDYISDPMTATTFREDKKGSRNREIITSELIYYWMIVSSIPFECEKWHLNRLITLIRVCSVKNEPPKKMSQRELLNRNSALNAARRKRFNSKG